MHSLMKNGFFNVIYKLSGIVFPLLTTTYASRILMPEGIGLVSYGQNVAAYFLAAASLGLPIYGVREISKARGSSSNMNSVFTELIVLNFIFTIISSVSFVIFLQFFLNDDITLYWICGLPIFFNFLNIDWFYQAKEEYKYIATRSILVKLFSFLSVLFFVNSVADYNLYALILSLAYIGNYVFNVLYARKYVRLKFSSLNLKKHMKPIASLGIVFILSSIYNNVDVTMLGFMSTNNVVGYYYNAHKGIEVVLTFCAAITATFFPRLSVLATTDRTELLSLLNYGIRIISFIVFPIMLSIIILSPHLVYMLFGSEFEPSSITLRIFSMLIVIRVFGDLFSYQLLIALGQEKIRIFTAVIATLFNIVLNYLLIPIYYQNGAAISSVISELVMNGLLLYYVLTHNQICVVWKKPILTGIITSAIMGGAIGIATLIICNTFLLLFLSLLLGTVVYLFSNYIVKNEITINLVGYITSKQDKY